MMIALKAQFKISNKYAQEARHNRVQITYNTSGAHHVQHVVSNVVQRDGFSFKNVLHFFFLNPNYLQVIFNEPLNSSL